MKTGYNASYVSAQSLLSNADYAGPSITLNQIWGYSIQAVWTSTSSLTGTLKLQASNDGSTWSDLPNTVSIAGSSGNQLWNVTDIAYQYARIFYAHTSGTGSLSANWLIKGV